MIVIPAKAGIQTLHYDKPMDSRFRGNDSNEKRDLGMKLSAPLRSYLFIDPFKTNPS